MRNKLFVFDQAKSGRTVRTSVIRGIDKDGDGFIDGADYDCRNLRDP